MKNYFKLLGIIALAAIIGFSMMGCGEDDDREELTGTVTILNTSPRVGDNISAITENNISLVEEYQTKWEWLRGNTVISGAT